MGKSNHSFYVLFLSFPGARFAESFGERIVVNLESRYLHGEEEEEEEEGVRFHWFSSEGAYLFVLIGRHRNELRFLEDVRPESAVRQLEQVVRSD